MSARSRPILVVDDDPQMREMICKAARQWGFESVAGTDPQHLDIETLPAGGILIIDLFMPQIDGVELLRLFARSPLGRSFLLISGGDNHLLRSARLLGEELGLDVVGVLHKPFRMRDLLRMLEARAPDAGSHRVVPLLTMEEITRGLAEDRLLVHYQPQIDMRSGRPVGVEALSRWADPTRGTLPPAAFIPLVERTPVIDEIARRVIGDAIGCLTRWSGVGIELGASVNFAPQTLDDVDLPDRIEAMVRSQHITPDRLTIELTETAVMQNFARSLDVLTRVRMKGFKLSIDDFGTGHSSLEKLAKIPFTELKIDRSFVGALVADNHSRVIARLTILLAHELGMTAVAEGIEDEEARAILLDLGCDVGQGFGIARPMPAQDVSGWCAARD